ncbi:MAG: CcmD family protein [Ignavibacteriae bacterium]|nr:MAG: CcmD family protein [Ignavibacteriota bacterium]
MDALYSFLERNSYYVVLIITLIIWLGLFLYMLSVDKKLKKIEKEHEV